MDPWTPLLIVGGAAAALLLLWWDQRRRMRRRRAALADAGARLGLAKVPVSTLREQGLFALPLLQEGHSRRVFHAFGGTRGRRRLVIFDYRYSKGRSKSRSTHSQTVVAVRQTGWNLPGFRLAPASLASRLGALVGLQSIAFDRHPEFRKAYRLRARNEPAVRALFADPVLAFFARKRGWTVEGGDEWLLAHRNGTSTRRGVLVPPEQLGALLDAAVEISALFGAHAKR